MATWEKEEREEEENGEEDEGGEETLNERGRR